MLQAFQLNPNYRNKEPNLNLVERHASYPFSNPRSQPLSHTLYVSSLYIFSSHQNNFVLRVLSISELVLGLTIPFHYLSFSILFVLNPEALVYIIASNSKDVHFVMMLELWNKVLKTSVSCNFFPFILLIFMLLMFWTLCLPLWNFLIFLVPTLVLS